MATGWVQGIALTQLLMKTNIFFQDDSEESGVGHEEDEEVQQLIIELLSNITTPRVSEILATSALLKWGPPLKDPTDPKFENTLDHITEDSDFSYEVRFLRTDNVYLF